MGGSVKVLQFRETVYLIVEQTSTEWAAVMVPAAELTFTVGPGDGKTATASRRRRQIVLLRYQLKAQPRYSS